MVARLEASGALDQGFGSGGVLELPLPNTYEAMADLVAIQADGRILIAGRAYEQAAALARPFVARLLSDGTQIRASMKMGLPLRSCGRRHTPGVPEAIAIDPSGRILLAGAHVIRFGGGDFSVTGLVVCFLPNGQLDASFGAPHQTGLKSVGALNTGFYGVNALPDGRILAAGRPGNYYAHVFAARLLANGSLDSSYQPVPGQGIADIPGPDPCRLGENSRGRCGRARFLLFSGRRASHAAGARGRRQAKPCAGWRRGARVPAPAQLLQRQRD